MPEPLTRESGEEEWKTETQMRIVNEIHKSQPARPEKTGETGRKEEWIWSGGSARVGSDSAGAQALNLGEGSLIGGALTDPKAREPARRLGAQCAKSLE